MKTNIFNVYCIIKVIIINSCLFFGPLVTNYYVIYYNIFLIKDDDEDKIFVKIFDINPFKLKGYLIAPIIEEIYFRFILLLVLDNDLKNK